MFSSICLGASQDDTVYNDQRDVDAKGGIECRNKTFHQKFHDGYKRCHNNDVCWHTHAVRDDFPKQGNHQVGGGQDDHRRKAHADAVLCRSGNRKRRTHTQHHDEGRVFFYDTIIKPFQRRIFSHEFPPSPESRPDSLQ